MSCGLGKACRGSNLPKLFTRLIPLLVLETEDTSWVGYYEAVNSVPPKYSRRGSVPSTTNNRLDCSPKVP
ncbi:hypothetical protein CABS01_00955 [Colletotrichum abscissum]|uniref:uncharacterized protein n=1 Tax=Colletotrichum abscissum TaxID=1671311 RepID=UPI0027D49AEC|nr:uncharacterized protein CABS01_00955 [Colletotrichum abscissum]KAK1505487.1 hypothetical protein CABS01_00955 [Colletotrichum abscissum]KAK1711792.1 hypothetical protein BDP67DRAFT_65140 [Colletotrichum lupini]